MGRVFLQSLAASQVGYGETSPKLRMTRAERRRAVFTDGGDDFVRADFSTLLKVALSLSKGEAGAG